MTEIEMNWQIFVTGVFIIVSVYNVIKPILALVKQVTVLNTTLVNMQDNFKSFLDTNKEEHKVILKELAKHGDILTDHEKKICFLEQR